MDLQRLMQQAQQMQKKMAAVQEELDAKVYEASSNGVVVKISGRNEVEKIEIPEEMMDKENKEMLQDVLLIAINDALSQAQKDKEEKLGSITNGIKMPGM